MRRECDSRGEPSWPLLLKVVFVFYVLPRFVEKATLFKDNAPSAAMFSDSPHTKPANELQTNTLLLPTVLPVVLL